MELKYHFIMLIIFICTEFRVHSYLIAILLLHFKSSYIYTVYTYSIFPVILLFHNETFILSCHPSTNHMAQPLEVGCQLHCL